MRTQNPPPPEVGDVFTGPEIGHGKPIMTGKAGKYYVRAVVDAEEHPEYGWLYEVVFRFWSLKYGGGWRYELVNAHRFGFGEFKKVSKKPARRKAS